MLAFGLNQATEAEADQCLSVKVEYEEGHQRWCEGAEEEARSVEEAVLGRPRGEAFGKWEDLA